MDDLRSVGDFYNDPGMDWSLRSVGPHLHPGSEEATVALATRAAAYGMATGGILLDLASALGAPARFIARRFASTVLCIDMDPRMHARAVTTNRHEGLGRLLQPLLARTEHLPLASASCDGAWSQDALCHMDKLPVLTEVARVLKPGAVFAFTDFVARPTLSAEELSRLRELWAFPSLFTIAAYAVALDALGFEVLVAEDRTDAILRGRAPGGLFDDDLWWHDFSRQWGQAEADARLEAGRYWQGLIQQGSAGYAMFIARKLS